MLGVTIIAGAFVILVNILIDFVYVLVDPRVSQVQWLEAVGQ